MDSSAIKALQDLVSAETVNRILLAKEEVRPSTPVVIPEGYKLVDTEQFDRVPNHFVGNFSTENINEFINYVNAYADDKTAIFVDGNRMKAHAIFDMGMPLEPNWGKHTAVLSLVALPEFRYLDSNNNCHYSQANFVDFVEDYASNIAFVDADGKGLEFALCLQALRKLTVETAGSSLSDISDNKVSTNKFDQIEVKSKGNVLPSGFRFSCDPYADFDEGNIDCKIKYVVNDGKLSVLYRTMRWHKVEQAITDVFVEILQDGIDLTKTIRLHQGVMSYRGK